MEQKEQKKQQSKEEDDKSFYISYESLTDKLQVFFQDKKGLKKKNHKKTEVKTDEKGRVTGYNTVLRVVQDTTYTVEEATELVKRTGGYTKALMVAIEADRIKETEDEKEQEEGTLTKLQEEENEFIKFHNYANERLQNFAERFHAHAMKMIRGPGKKRVSSKSSSAWLYHFNLLIGFRTLNKFHRPFVNSIIAYHIDFLLNCLKGLQTNLVKESLILVKELFEQTSEKQPLNSLFYQVFIPVLFKRSINEKKFISSAAYDAIVQLEQFYYEPRVAILLSNMMFNKNPKISESAASSIAYYISNFSEMQHLECLNKFKRKELVSVLRGIVQGIQGGRSVIKKLMEKSLKSLNNGFKIIGGVKLPDMKEAFPFKQYLECALDASQYKHAVNCIEGKKKEDEKKPKKSIKDFLKEKRQNKKNWKAPEGFVFIDEKEANEFGHEDKTFEDQCIEKGIIDAPSELKKSNKENTDDHDDEI